MRYIIGNALALQFLLSAFLHCAFAEASAAKKRVYNLEVGPAEETLQLAAKQGRIELVFASDLIAGYETRPLKGKFLVQDALEQLLEGTPFVAVPVSGGQAYGIIERVEKGGDVPDRSENTLQKNTTIQTQMNLQKAKTKKAIGGFFKGLLAIAITVATQLPAQDDASVEEVFELSPFTVDASENQGYRATQTMAGTRLKTSVRDVAASIQILTADFLDDIGATSNSDLFLYTTNTEAAGDGGNFTDYAVPEGTSYSDESVRVSPQDAQRIRGLGRADITRNYFPSRIPTDRFNMDSVEINRGANSILFGLGSPAGIANSSMSRAKFRDSGSLSYKLDGEGTNRFTLDYNKVLLEDRLAARFSYLNEEKRFRQEQAYQNQVRYYGTATGKLWKGATLRGFFEVGERDGNRPSQIGPGYTLPYFFEQLGVKRELMQELLDENGVLDVNGNPLQVPSDYDTVAFNSFYADLRTNNNWINVSDVNNDGVIDAADDLARLGILRQNVNWNLGAVGRGNDERTFNHANASRAIFTVFEHDSADPTTGRDGITAIESRVAKWGYGFQAGHDFPYEVDPSGNNTWPTYHFYGSVQPWRNIDNSLPPTSVSNLEQFDFTENLLSGYAAFQNDDWDQYNLSLEQVLWDGKAGFELVHDEQSYDNESFVPFQGYSGIFVDVNEFRKGRPNPNYGRTFVQGKTVFKSYSDRRESTRATAFLNIDTKDYFGDNMLSRVLGSHTITGLVNKYDQSRTDSVYREYSDSPEAIGNNISAGDVGAHWGRFNNYIVYISDDSVYDLDSIDDVRLNPLTAPQLWGGGHTSTVESFNVNTGGYELQSFGYEPLLDNYTERYESVESQSAILNSYFLDRHLVGLAGWRKDKIDFRSYNSNEDPVTAVSLPGDLVLDNDEDEGDINTFTWSIVGHVPSKFLPESVELSAYYGESENFSLSESALDFYGANVASPSGETKEYGITMSLFDRRMHVRLNKFETNLLNSPAEVNLYSTYVNQQLMHIYGVLLSTEAMGRVTEWYDHSTDPATLHLNEDGTVWDPMPNYDVAMDALSFFRQQVPDFAYNTAFSVDPDETGFERTGINVTDTEDVASEGFEAEIVFNPTDKWRIALNVAKQETVKTNYSPRLAELMEIFDPYIGHGGAIYDQPFNFTELDVEGTSPPQYFGGPNLYEGYLVSGTMESRVYAPFRVQKALEGQTSPEQRKWRANLITNYSFNEGALKGFSVGSAVRWQQGASIGYPTWVEDGLIMKDIQNPHITPAEIYADAWLRYGRKIWDDKVRWNIELRVKNLNTDADELIPVRSTNSEEYGVAIWKAGAPRTWSLSNSFRF